jgi:hypothetical protein
MYSVPVNPFRETKQKVDRGRRRQNEGEAEALGKGERDSSRRWAAGGGARTHSPSQI